MAVSILATINRKNAANSGQSYEAIALGSRNSIKNTSIESHHSIKQTMSSTSVPLHFVGDAPALSRPIVEICRESFDLLTTDEAAIEDLSLPPRDKLNIDFRAIMNAIQFIFRKVPDDEAAVPVSYTKPCHTGVDILAVVQFYYAEREVLNAPEIIDARILHESTHAIRHVLIILSDKTGVDDNRLLTPTPAKDPRTMHYAAASSAIPLYKLDKPAFHSGHYVQHRLRGGIWGRLDGYVLNSEGKAVELDAGGVTFKVVHKGESRTATIGKHGGLFTFVRLQGYDQAGNYNDVYHYGKCSTCTDDESTRNAAV